MIEVNGYCDNRFAPIKDVFKENFESHGDVGASVAVFRHGEPVIDLWGGHLDLDRTEPWSENTLVNIWSTTKGVTATCFAMAVDRGALAYEDKVAKYWPEFGVAGKDSVTVAMLLSHQAGLCGFKDAAALEDFFDIDTAAAKLAAAEPFWTPGTQSGYHAVTMGVLASKLLQLAEGRTVAQFVDDELRKGMGLDIFIGAPESERSRVSNILASPDVELDDHLPTPNAVQIAALANPPLEPAIANLSEWRAAEIPSGNGHATAQSLAKLYSALASDGAIEGRSIASMETIKQAISPQIEGVDAVLSIPTSWGCGFMLNSDGLYGTSPGAFGHSGWGGSFAFGDPGTGLGIAYTMNHMGAELAGDPRSVALVEAVYSVEAR